MTINNFQRNSLKKLTALQLISFVFFVTGLVVLQSCKNTASISSPAASSAASPAASSAASPSVSASALPAASSAVPSDSNLDWLPPKPSASAIIPLAVIRKPQGKVVHLGDVNQKLSDALDSKGYTEKNYFVVPNGFAIVTKFEHINSDGTSRESDRWKVVDNSITIDKFSLKEYLAALFTANPGYYRVIVFVVTSQPSTVSNQPLNSDKAEVWSSEGLDRLPKAIANLEFTEEYQAKALIYEFRKLESEKKAAFSYPSNLNGDTHLKRAKLWDDLVK